MVCFSCSGAKPRKRKPFGIPGRRKDKDTDSTWVKISSDTISATYFYFPSSKNKLISNHDVMLLYARESTEVEAAVSIIFIKTTSFSSSPSLYFSFLCSNRRRRWKKCPVHVILLCILQLEHVTRFTFSPCVPPCLFCRFARSFIHSFLSVRACRTLPMAHPLDTTGP